MVPDPTAADLSAPALRPLPLGQLRPAGWLRRQLRLQADGMAGHLDEIWPDIGDSAWIGGAAEGWERGPYWLDAIVPLSALLDDERLKEKVQRWVDYILDHQDVDGWLGPQAPDPSDAHSEQFGPYDVWPRMVLLKALLQFHDGTGDDRIIPAALRLCRRIDGILADWPLHEWGRVRWADLVLCLDTLYDLTHEAWLPEMADRVRAQGYDWAAFSAEFPYRSKVSDESLRHFQDEAGGVWMNDRHLSSHGVNVAMGLRSLPVWSRHSESGEEQAAFRQFIDRLDEFHGQATGAFTADEHLAGLNPAQGTETCAVVEYLFSLAVALEVWGSDEAVVDRWERLAFNALPASARPDEWGHQYDQQANQVICHVTEDRVYSNNGPDANIFGLEPHFGCCTANRHQGWPKFAARLWMIGPDDGLTALSYAPCDLDTRLGGRRVRIEVSGDYPFADRVQIAVVAEDGAEFAIRLRIPAWVDGASIAVDDQAPMPAAAGSIVPVRQDWGGRHQITLLLPAGTRVESRPGEAVAVSRGPVLFALAVGEDWRQVGGQEPHGTWEIHPTAPWNYSLELDPADPDAALRVETTPVAGSVFSTDGAPIRLHGRARIVPRWTLEHGAAAAPPPSPCPGTGPAVEATLLPYGAARLRVTDLPWHRPTDTE
ncbi:MAG TPA: beta-L-arabinofuranosidase domain-containing protein [Mycobacteriales bacterium]|nr:beta-L-arabinofuranosidase domain-containing protein [Mycobacteriales bacterium]